MALRWTAAAFPAVEENFRRIMDHNDLRMPEAALDEPQHNQHLAEAMKAS